MSGAKAGTASIPLPDEVRNQLGRLVTEVRGAGRLLYIDEVATDSETSGAINGLMAEASEPGGCDLTRDDFYPFWDLTLSLAGDLRRLHEGRA